MRLGKIFNHIFLLNCCNLVFLSCGTALIFFGFQLFSDSPRILLSRLLAATSEPLNQLSHPLFFYIALSLAAAGVIAVLAAIIGFWASCLNTYCFLSLYFLTVIVLLLIESAACLAITIWPQCLGLSLDETKMVKVLQGYYGVPKKEQFTIAMDLAQTKFGCCGISSDANYENSLWRLQSYGQKDWPVPISCCTLENSNDRLVYLDPKPKNISRCQSLLKSEYEKFRHNNSCLEYLDIWYREQYVMFLIICLLVAIVEFCVLLSIVLNCTRLAKNSKVREIIEKNRRRNSQQNTVLRRSQPNLIENLYELSPEMHQSRPSLIPMDEIKEVFVQPQDLYKNRHNTTFKPSRNQYHISRSYLV